MALVVGLSSVVVGAYERTLDPRAIEQALSIGLSRIDADRERFHRPYQTIVNRAPVDWIDIVTPFRRVALEAESRTRAGARLFGQREALEALASAPERVDVIVELSFHPLNTFVGVPDYGVVLMQDGLPLQPQNIERVPRFGPRVGGTLLPYPWRGGVRIPRGSEPLLGGTIVAQFDGAQLTPDGTYDVVIADAGKELARGRVNFGSVR